MTDNKDKKKGFKFTFKSCSTILFVLVVIQLVPMLLLTVLNNFVRISRTPLLNGAGCFPTYMFILIMLFIPLSLFQLPLEKKPQKSEDESLKNESEENVSSE